MANAISVSDLAAAIGGKVIGDGSRMVSSCNTLTNATAEQVTLLHNSRYLKQLETTKAGCVIVSPGAVTGEIARAAGLEPVTFIEVKDTYFGWQQAVVKLIGYRQHPSIGISPLASIHPSAKLGDQVNIHAYAVVGENAVIGNRATIYPHVTIMHGATVGNDTVLFPSVTVYENCHVGNRCILHAGTVIGSDGFSYALSGGVHHKIPQNGNVRIEDDVEIGSNSIVERAVLETTTVGRGTKIGNVVVVGHNCLIGQGNILVSQVGIAGSTTTGKYVFMAGQSAVNGHIHIPDFVKIGAQAGVVWDPEPNTNILGSPAIEAGKAKRMFLSQMQLPELAKRVKELEKLVAKLQGGGGGGGRKVVRGCFFRGCGAYQSAADGVEGAAVAIGGGAVWRFFGDVWGRIFGL